MIDLSGTFLPVTTPFDPVTGDVDKVDSLQNLLRSFGVLEGMRTGTIAMSRGGEDQADERNPDGSRPRMESGL